jgi:hypothetical protein
MSLPINSAKLEFMLNVNGAARVNAKTSGRGVICGHTLRAVAPSGVIELDLLTVLAGGRRQQRAVGERHTGLRL